MDYSNIFIKKLFKPEPPSVGARFANYFQVLPGKNNWGPRVIGDYELILIVRGGSTYRETNKDLLKIEEGGVLLIPPDIEHLFSCDPALGTIISCIHFSFECEPGLGSGLVFHTENDYELVHLFRKCAAEFDRKGGHWQTVLNLCVREIWIRIQRAGDLKPIEKRSVKLQRALEYLGRNLDNPFNRRALADYLKVTPEHVNHLFRNGLRSTPTEYLNGKRIEKACELLMAPGLNISQVAYKTGFTDPLYFSRVFKKSTGVSPKEYASRV